MTEHRSPNTAARRRFGLLAAGTTLYIYALIVFGGIVRITGSGLGCGDDWPRCNGHWIPPFDFATLIEYTHRLLAAALIVPFAALVWFAWRHRAEPGFGGRGGANRPVAWAVALLAVQVILGAVTVKLDLPAAVTAAHFVNAMLLLGALVLAAVRAFGADAATRGRGDTATPHTASLAASRPRRVAASGGAIGAVALGLIVITFGALTANAGLPAASGQPSAAAWACQGFPLCNGQLVPAGEPLVHIHWTHRLLAFLLLFHVLGATIGAWRRATPRVARAAAVAFGLVVAQLAVAAGLVLLRLPDSLQALHLAVGVAVWIALVAWAALARAAAADARIARLPALDRQPVA